MTTKSECCSPGNAAVALARWCLGVIFLFYGIGKFGDVAGFVAYLAGQFENTWLPQALVTAFGRLLPYAEVILGAALLLGICRNVTLFLTCLLLIGLTFGQVLLKQPQVVFFNFGYTAATAALLFLDEHDRWTLFPWRCTRKPSAPPAAT